MKFKFGFGKLIAALVELYKAVFSGKTITVGGETITLPSEGNVPPLKGSPFDSKPHVMEPPKIGGPR